MYLLYRAERSFVSTEVNSLSRFIDKPLQAEAAGYRDHETTRLARQLDSCDCKGGHDDAAGYSSL